MTYMNDHYIDNAKSNSFVANKCRLMQNIRQAGVHIVCKPIAKQSQAAFGTTVNYHLIPDDGDLSGSCQFGVEFSQDQLVEAAA